jgi:5'-nucleotidase (lipoprotein e(P4) family)
MIRGVRAFPAVGLALLAACATAPEAAPPPPPLADSAPAAASPAIAPPVRPAQPPAAMQWLYGSGEGAAASLQAYDAFRNFVVARARSRPVLSVVLDSGATLQSPSFVPCGDRPLAVVLDVDETVLQNLGAEYDEAVHPGRSFSEERWLRWEQTGANAVSPMPGAVAALGAIRDAGVTVIFNTNRTAENAAQTAVALEAAGLAPARHGETLYLKGDVASGSGKDPRRAAISQRYCVVAMAGDQLGDFSDLFNARSLAVPARRQAASSPPFAALWGNGWFLLSNPVYGPSIRGTIDEVFPADKRWSDPQGGNSD